MFQKIIQFSIQNKLIIGILTLALIIWGSWSLSKLPFDSTPDITSNQVQIIAQAPSLGAQEVEQYITSPVEMALANIPRIEERRSISRNGLAVITLVFDDNADIYWAREQVSLALKEAEDEIDGNQCKLSLAPISTGLGEIYHYTIHPKKGYEDKFSLTEIRTIQDWIVRKQLSGTPGVAEVSGWGGYVKQYEVAVDADKLNSAGITLTNLYSAIEANNQNTGGGYIEQHNNQYYIRGIGVAHNEDDIANIPVRTNGNAVTLVKDVAKVGIGAAQRNGAVTRNGEGEVVAGIALMLKGENFQEVAANVKGRIAQIQKTLPEGLVIEPFIDRTNLVNRVTGTISHNLIEGGLIVVFILILFLGNYRAGLVVASVIPLSMLFAFGMMKIFGVSGNLMSLGAIDFGLIVDSAVILVEAVCCHISKKADKYPSGMLTQNEMDEETFKSASAIRTTAAFGEIIIMCVYVPLFTLVGIEGKMFRPMALTIFFAIMGAFVLSLTYVPMASSLILDHKIKSKENLSDKINKRLHNWYLPALKKSLNNSKAIIGTMVAFFVGALFVFANLGGEFIPTLGEGDFAAEMSMAQGTSLNTMVENCTKAEQLIKQKFPEVKQVVTRIGSAEIPTDPMPVERADMMIALIPREEWTSADNRIDLMEMMEETLCQIPGLEVEMSQPIQMRNNELITGIRQDVAIMIYGNNMEELNRQARKVAKLIRKVEGISDPYIEQVSGLPQVQIHFNRSLMSRYGISIQDANSIIQSAYAGRTAGKIYEGERCFDIVVRMDNSLRNNPEKLSRLYIPIQNGGTVPLSQIADIKYENDLAQITHEEGTRRIYVGFNVNKRDVQSVIADVQNILDEKLKMPSGYYYTYGGDFKNMQEATRRLSVAIPAALCLILLLLYATLKNIKESMFVFSAIPLSAIGGILALWFRGLPFSISAGVGFIALFGVSVLNGIVLVGQFNNLEKSGIEDVRERIVEGCSSRLRPVIMTALVASFGFLPMALSQSDGAEVQRPLATVVIGGLLTSTLLTLFVLPSIYKTFKK